ncbi:restriction endonuclease subunit S [Roseomonas harenae]|uniref:restriction endonuclease subunit S n=1 Tax=Muricoccus harenae TaxID=2692566 RepID=UPI0013315ED9|nr:restriction endonuclease subunit S [Roseomonas harenae]
MNADVLLAYYERIAEAPDAINRLRRFMLDLAVRGKLVPQDPADEPASELLKRISLEKAQLVKTGQARADKAFPTGEDDALFGLPESWCWTRLGTVSAYIQRGKSPKYAVSVGTPVVSQKCVQWRGLDLSVAKLVTLESIAEYETVRFLRDGDLLWNSTGTGTIGRVIRLVTPPDRLVCDSHVTVVRCFGVDPEFVRTWLRSDHVFGTIEERAAGSTNQVELTAQMVVNQLVPLPPLAEQHRIVAKVDELMALCDRLAAARTTREVTRDRLAAASLARLNTPDSETFSADGRFALNTLPAITTRPDQIKQLRQTILNLAVRGKLVPQDSGDEPASLLISTMRRNFSNSGDRKASTRFAPIADDQLSYSTPAGWEWACAEDLTIPGEVITYGILKPEWVENGVPTVRVTEMKTGTIDVATLPKCSPARAASFTRTTLAEGDLLVSKDGTIGKTAFVPSELVGGNITQHVLRFPISTVVDRHFVKLVIDAPPYQALMAGETKGVALQGVNVGDFRRMPIPLPPLAEQHRIVAKVNVLMALCDQLEASLATASTSRAKLLEATLREALLPTEETLLEAAQ